MNLDKFVSYIPVIVAILGVVLLVSWLIYPAEPHDPRVPAAPQRVASEIQQGVLTGQLIPGKGMASALTGMWPWFRGYKFDGWVDDQQCELGRSWDTDPPRLLWSITVGEGYAGASIRAGRVYLLDYDQDKKADVLRCLSLDNGQDIWRYAYPVKVKRNHGMTRTVCAVSDKIVVSLGPKCHVTCLDKQTGALQWAMDLVRERGAKVPLWYAGQCPLIDDDRVILAVGGEQLLLAVSAQTGEVIWESANPHAWEMTHSSITPMEVNGQKQYVYCASGGVAGISATNGEILWQTDQWRIRIATVPSPVAIPPDRIFFTGGYNAGSLMIRLSHEQNAYQIKTLFRLDPKTFGATQHTPILYQDYLYGIRADEQLVCLDLEGHVRWSSGSNHRYGIGPFLVINGLLYVMNDSGMLSLAEAKPEGFRLLGDSQVLSGHDSWGPMAYASGRLIVRDLTEMKCLDIRAQ